MADYWKSVPRHFCEFCKCWIADNKPSRDYHEKGKKHQENVAKKIVDVRKKGAKKAEKEEELSSTLQAIEKAALKALKEDLKKDPSLADKYGIQLNIPKPNEPQKTETKTTIHENKTINESKSAKIPNARETPSVTETPGASDWEEAKSPDGYTYYWNSKTSVTTWIKPEGYISPKETDESVDSELAVASSSTGDPIKYSEESKSETAEGIPQSVKALPEDQPTRKSFVPSQKTAAFSKSKFKKTLKKEKGTEQIESRAVYGPASKPAAPYGNWETIEKEEEEPVNFELPEQKQQVVTKVIPISEPKIKFREKKVDTLGAELVAFKKRKLNTAALKMRKREDDDD